MGKTAENLSVLDSFDIQKHNHFCSLKKERSFDYVFLIT